MASVATAIKAAQSKLGANYVWGAEGPNTFDCSGLMVWAWERAGVHLPRTSQQQATYGTAVKAADIRPGDLVTSDWGNGPSSHVGMYIGGGKLIHAPRPGSVVKIANLDANYRSHVNTIRRVPGADQTGVEQAGLIGDWWEWEKGWSKKLLGGDPEGAAKDFLGGAGILGPLNAIGSGLGSVATGMLSVGKFAEFLLKLALPSTWVRIACGIAGTAALFIGLWFLARETLGG